eukprot:TRINITY_DN11021_c2_g1_i1.p1 TRINITY_DN11021_c2_g1~~TRINITY_DN11021_c2_g1_i1.p1  ORF type:complete len:222 (-),score=48.97 TRINITY_DN11021_c2_g1_i1:120-749(-)
MLEGVVKSFVWAKGWGFIKHKDQDIFFHVNDFKRGVPEDGSPVLFEMGESKPGTKSAVNIQGSVKPGSIQGTVKSFAASTGYGFIVVNGKDVFVHMRDVLCGGLKNGDIVWLDLEASDKDPNRFVATNVTGGSGHTDQGGTSEFSGRGKGGKGGGKGGKFGSGYGPSMEAMQSMMQAMQSMMMMGPYGGSGGKAKGKDKGKGKGKGNYW